MNEAEMIEWIDNASYENLLRKWRFASTGNPLFIGEIGRYYKKTMFYKRDKCNHVKISKKIGWKCE